MPRPDTNIGIPIAKELIMPKIPLKETSPVLNIVTRESIAPCNMETPIDNLDTPYKPDIKTVPKLLPLFTTRLIPASISSTLFAVYPIVSLI
jgi:hypothetical protein